jgi:hypothetical protein
MTETPSTPEGEPTASSQPGAYGAPGGDATAAYPAPGGYPAADAAVAEPKRGPGRGVIIGIGATVLAVIAGAAVYATTALSGGGRQPDELAPRSTFAYAKLDLDPAANQKLAAREFFGKFPELKKSGADGENPFEALLAKMFEGEENFSYEADVKPWFDKRIGIAGYRGADGPAGLGIIQSKDDAKAKKAMDKAVAEAKKDGDEFAYRIEKGYVVVSDTQAHLDDALKQAAKENIKDNKTFSEDVDRLDGDQVIVGWVDMKAAFDAVKSEIPDAGLIPNAITDQLQGRIVTGLHLDGDYAEVSGYVVGAKQPAKPPAAGEAKLLKNLPADTVAAVSVNGLGDQIKEGLGQLGSLGQDPEALVGPFLQEMGLDLDNDLLPLLGDQTVISLGGIPLGIEDVSAGLLSTVKDPGAAKANGEKLAAALSEMGVPLRADVSGNTFYLATQEYLPALKAGKGLGDSEKFKKAVGDADSVSMAMYVDLDAIIGEVATPDEAKEVEALSAVGVTAGYDKGVPFFRLRVVAL